MMNIPFSIAHSRSLSFPVTQSRELFVRACSVFKSLSMVPMPVTMALCLDTDANGVPLYSMVELLCAGSTISMQADNLSLLIETKNSLSYIDDLVIGTLDPIRIGDIPVDTTS